MAKLMKFLFYTCLFSVLVSPVAFAQTVQLANPMRPLHYVDTQSAPAVKSEKPLQPPVWKLTTVLLAADRRIAVINGKLLQVGDSLDGYQLVEILFDRVQLQKNKTKVLLRRPGTGLRKDIR